MKRLYWIDYFYRVGLRGEFFSFLFVDSRDLFFFFFHILSQSNLVGHLSEGNAKADTD